MMYTSAPKEASSLHLRKTVRLRLRKRSDWFRLSLEAIAMSDGAILSPGCVRKHAHFI